MVTIKKKLRKKRKGIKGAETLCVLSEDKLLSISCVCIHIKDLKTTRETKNSSAHCSFLKRSSAIFRNY